MKSYQAISNLMKKGKKGAASYLKTNYDTSPDLLVDFLDYLLEPSKDLNDANEWIKWLIAGGQTPDEFIKEVKQYDNATTCGLVWTANFVAYRCRTCGISPCMSLCAECFQRGKHEGHDFNMFRSQAGGACDCGDTSVMKEIGFCGRHGPQVQEQKPNAPEDLMFIPNAIMPRLIYRLIQHMRERSHSPPTALVNADPYLNMLHDFSGMGAAMRHVMTQALIDPQVYKDLTEWSNNSSDDPETSFKILSTTHIYQQALKSLANPEPPERYKECPSLQEHLVHKTFLEELMFWTVKFEFPQKVVCLLLNMLPDAEYKEALTRAFVLHYSRIPIMLEKSRSPDTLSNRVVHVSVQLFSNESLAIRMTEQLSLLHVMVISLKYMMSKILIPSVLHDPDKNFHYVVDCAQQVMKEHCYWPLVSDLNNVLSHRPVALMFMSDNELLEMWFDFLAVFQGMNVNQRELCQHVEFEPSTYYAAFSAELEASAYPMWALVSHLDNEATLHLTRSILNSCISALQDWFDAINFRDSNIQTDHKQVSFHLPLHRYLAVLMSQAVKCQGVTLKQVLPPPDILHLVLQHPLRLQVAFYEILNGMWVRNGLQIKGQMMTYIQCNFCNSMVDADLYLLQVCATQLAPEIFLNNVLDVFRIVDGLSIAPYRCGASYFDCEYEPAMIESCLTFLSTLIDVRSNLGVDDTWLTKLEMVTLLCMGDKTHSQLYELMPERSGTGQTRDLDTVLDEVADYRAPNNMQQGMYAPKPHVWEELYDPIHVLLRAVHRRDFQTSMDRFTEFVQQHKKIRPSGGCGNVWPPFRPPAPCGDLYDDPRKVLESNIFHAVIFCLLYKAVDRQNLSEHVLALTLYLLEMAILSSPKQPSSQIYQHENCVRYDVKDKDLSSFYETDWLSHNLRTVISTLEFKYDNELIDMDVESESSASSQDFSMDLDGSPAPLSLPSLEFVQFEDSGSTTVANNEQNPVEVQPQEQPSTSQELVPQPSTSHAQQHPNNRTPRVSQLRSLTLRNQTQIAQIAVPAVRNPTAWQIVYRPLEISTTSSGNEVALSSSSSRPNLSRNKKIVLKQSALPECEGTSSSSNQQLSVEINESIISLLLKLHSQLSGTPDSYQPGEQAASGHLESRIGDGCFFVAKVLDRIALLDDRCKECIKTAKEKIWPKRNEEDCSEAKAREAKEREERRKRAKERQQKLMEEFASRQKQFMEKAMETEENCDSMDWNEDGTAQVKKSEYDCVICNQTTPSTLDTPMGLVVLVQASSVLGHKRRTEQEEVLPTCDEERKGNLRDGTLASEMDKHFDNMNREFDTHSWLLTVNLGWEGGVHVQTCGHHLHMDCLKSYLQSLRSQQRQQSIAVDRGEYSCPLCRQLANSVLPIAPELGENSHIVRVRQTDLASQIQQITNLLKNNTAAPQPSNLSEAMGKSMEDMTGCTFVRYQQRTDGATPQSLFLFVSSVARTNLEIEVVQKGGSFLTKNVDPTPSTSTSTSTSSSLTPKRSCILPLLHVLSVHARILAQWPVWQSWQQLSELPTDENEGQLAHIEKQVPLLLCDPTALLIQLLLFLPLNLDQSYFNCLVKSIYNLLYFQILAQISIEMSDSDRESWRSPASKVCSEIRNLDGGLGFVISQLDTTNLYVDCDGIVSSNEKESRKSRTFVEKKVQTLALPFLRIAALLRHHLFNEEIPQVRTEQTEFVRLVYYLELVTDGMDWSKFNSSVALMFSENGLMIPRLWFRQLAAYIERSQQAARHLISRQHLTWYPPRLLKLPDLYDKIFQYYHRKQCVQCHGVPREASICLLCGTLVCLKENCCKNRNMCEAVQHSIDCGAGTAAFLVVTSSYVIVIRGKRACLWGSVYLDNFGEEDRELKRGKPLYLCNERYQLLQEQWLAHRFDHTNKKWVWHRDAL